MVTAFGRFSVLVASVMVVMASPLSVKASLWLEFEPPEAAPGAEVIAVTIGQDATTGALANLSPDNVVVLYLGAEEDDVDGPGDSAAMRIGKLEIDEAGHGRLAFTVPDIEPGTYVAYLHCETCSFDAEGLSFSEAGLFNVAQAQLPATGLMLAEVVTLGLAPLTVGVTIGIAVRRTRV